MTGERVVLERLFQAALAAVAPAACLPPHLPPPPRGRTVVVGAGKAAAAMAQVVDALWPPAPLSGLVITRYGHGVEAAHGVGRIEVIEAAHPVPDASGMAGAARVRAAVSGLGADDLVLALISGGASALLTLPAAWVSLADKQLVTRALLRAGAPIGAINTVRKHLSAIKGGRLAEAAWPARLVSLLISDVPGDDPAVIGSGPTVGDPTTLAEARAVLRRYGIDPPACVAARLADGAAETPKPGAACFAGQRTVVLATGHTALQAAATAARAAGLTPIVLGAAIDGDAEETAGMMAALARQVSAHASPGDAPCVLLSGGETTIDLKQGETGRGGRNTAFLLALAIALDGHAGVHAIACDTDGIDGSEHNAGASIAPDTLARAAAAGLDPQRCLAGRDSYTLFSALGDLVVTGPTRTNVSDFRAILVNAGGSA